MAFLGTFDSNSPVSIIFDYQGQFLSLWVLCTFRLSLTELFYVSLKKLLLFQTSSNSFNPKQSLIMAGRREDVAGKSHIYNDENEDREFKGVSNKFCNIYKWIRELNEVTQSKA